MSERSFICSTCGAIVGEKAFILDESGNRVLNCPDCNARIRFKRMVAVRPLPTHLSKMPEARFNKRPI